MTGKPSLDKPWLKYYTKEEINSQLPEMTLYEYLYENNKDYLNNIALTYYGTEISYGNLFAKIEEAAKAFMHLGVKEGDIVTICAVTIPEIVFAYYALNKIGAVSNMIDPRTNEDGIRRYLNEVNAKLLVMLDICFPKVERIANQTGIENVIVVSPADSLSGVRRGTYRIKELFAKNIRIQNHGIYQSWAEFISSGKSFNGETSVGYSKDRLAIIVHTGGTTGSPKGVMLSNDNLNASAYQGATAFHDFKREHTWMNIMPPFIAYGIGNGLHMPLCIGMTIILIPAFNPAKYAALLLQHKPNHMLGVPSHYGILINSPKLKNKDLSFVTIPIVGGDAMSLALEEQTNRFLENHSCNFKISKGYGMTEVCAAVSICASNEVNRIGSVGVPSSHTCISIFDLESGQELAFNQIGEICSTGPNTMLGYYNDKTATDDLLRKHKDGRIWVHSGDLGYMDEDGFLYVVDRIKRMIIRADGFKVFPSEIENILAAHVAVEACKVVGIPDVLNHQGSLPKAHIVLKSEYIGAEKRLQNELIALCTENLPEYAVPQHYEFRKDFPFTPIGKVDFMALENEDMRVGETN